MSQAAVQVEVEPLFGSTHAALVFAFNFSHQAYDRPVMNRMADGPKRSGKGLVGLDGAGQAGMIRAEVATLKPEEQHLLITKFSPRTEQCECRAPCCAGRRPAIEWLESIEWLIQYVLRAGLTGQVSHYQMRRMLVMKSCGVKTTQLEIADRCGVSRATVAEYMERIGKHFSAAMNRAEVAIDAKLKAKGIVES